MPFQSGHTKTGGRMKGTPNHATRIKLEEARQTFSRLSFNPVQEAIKLFRSRKAVPDHRIKLVAELLKYWAPKLSTQDIKHRIEGNLQITEAIHQVLLSADPQTIRALEQVSFKLDEMARESQPVTVIDVEPLALPAPVEPEDE